jgi:hypothetical protein
MDIAAFMSADSFLIEQGEAIERTIDFENLKVAKRRNSEQTLQTWSDSC